ncbi:MAG: hypothetical protein V2B20_23445 [Pseudomonadota bacterium]
MVLRGELQVKTFVAVGVIFCTVNKKILNTDLRHQYIDLDASNEVGLMGNTMKIVRTLIQCVQSSKYLFPTIASPDVL